jgi:TPR repeat protein/antitoxin component YwqK of YwqJK toxin-antitoxin module/RNA polymerase subunit RPABC4/transcription elongation factor Spt4
MTSKLQPCKECGHMVSKSAKTCPSCGVSWPAKKGLSFIHWIGIIVFVPTLLMIMFSEPSKVAKVDKIHYDDHGAKKIEIAEKGYPSSNALFSELDSEVGCLSKYSDNKKEDIFNTRYKNKWMTWYGEIDLSESSNVSLNIDGKGTQDLSVEFSDKNAGYNLTKGTFITVKFLMKSAGGCFLPFSGDSAIIIQNENDTAQESKPSQINKADGQNTLERKNDITVADVAQLQLKAMEAERENVVNLKGSSQTFFSENCPKQLAFWQQAAEQRQAIAQSLLAGCYLLGTGTPKDEAQAINWYQKAADQGYALAQSNLGVVYRDGIGLAKDEAQAMLWFRKAAEQGYALAQNNLGFIYANSEGNAKDEAQAVEWYRKAAEQGNAQAQSNLGFMYANGKGIAKDEAQAVAWYRKAAEQGNAEAQNLLKRIESSKATEQGKVEVQANGANSEGIAKNELDEANKQINIVWKSTTKTIRAALLPEQRQWLKQRENDCSLKATSEEPNNIVLQDTIKLHCMAAMTGQRTEELKQKIASITDAQQTTPAPIANKTPLSENQQAPENNQNTLEHIETNERITTTTIQIRNGVGFLPNEDVPFTGKYEKYYPNGQKEQEINWKNGKIDGLSTEWYENGQKSSEANWKGSPNGSMTTWYENGQKKSEGNWKDGKPNGLNTDWYENGQKKSEGNWKNGKFDGLITQWYENGQKSFEANFKNGDEIKGQSTYWDENGQKVSSEQFYKRIK